jgi:hypothetical protein
VNETVITTIGLGVGSSLVGAAVCQLCYADEKLRVRAYLFMASGGGVMTITSVLMGNTFTAAVDSAMTAFSLWSWWNSGGGGGMRSLMKRLTSAFGSSAAPQTM